MSGSDLEVRRSEFPAGLRPWAVAAAAADHPLGDDHDESGGGVPMT